MSFARIRLIFLTAVASLAISLGMTSVAGAASITGHVYPALDTAAASANYSQTAARSGYVILQAWETQRLHSLKAENPAIKVLVYENLAFSADSPQGPLVHRRLHQRSVRFLVPH